MTRSEPRDELSTAADSCELTISTDISAPLPRISSRSTGKEQTEWKVIRVSTTSVPELISLDIDVRRMAERRQIRQRNGIPEIQGSSE